jgi:hypothetical protein
MYTHPFLKYELVNKPQAKLTLSEYVQHNSFYSVVIRARNATQVQQTLAREVYTTHWTHN